MAPIHALPSRRALARCSLAVAVAIAALLAAACGTNDGGSALLPGATQDARTASAASAVAGTAADAGLNQLYAGGSIALREQPLRGALNDGGSGVDEIIRSLGTARPDPFIGAGMITRAAYSNPIVTSGSISYSSDTSGLPANWFHIVLDVSAASPFTITTDEGDRASLTGGQIDLYVQNVDGADDGAGNWSRTVDSYVSIPSTNPLTIAVTLSDGTVRDATVSGERHVNRIITRTVAGTTVSRTDAVTIDGIVAGVPIAPPWANGPGMLDRNGTSQVFTQWNQTVQVHAPGGTVDHAFGWNRYCTYTVSYSYQVGAVIWSGAISNYFENVYVSRDGVQVGPLSDLQLFIDYHVLHDINGSGGQF